LALSRFSVLTRRRFLKALGAGGLLAAGSAGWLVALRGCAPSVAGLSCLTEHEHRTLTALAVALFPEGGAFAAGAASRDLARTFDAYLADEDEDRQSDLKRALLLLEYGPLVYDHRGVTFSHLSAEERLAHFESWTTSAELLRRQIALAFRKFLSMVFYDDETVWAQVGYEAL